MENNKIKILNKAITDKTGGQSMSIDNCLNAMSEYAQLESIEFAEWKANKNIQFDTNKKKWGFNTYFSGLGYSETLYYTTSELYQIFKQEQQTTKNKAG